jgi:transposase
MRGFGVRAGREHHLTAWHRAITAAGPCRATYAMPSTASTAVQLRTHMKRLVRGCPGPSGLRILKDLHPKGRDHVAGKYRKFTPEFREEAARMVVETSRPIAEVARELGINETSLGNWVRDYRKRHADDEPPLQLSERARLRELERENRELRMKNDFLSKAAAYFAAEHR